MKPLYYLVFAGARFYPSAAGDLKTILRADLVSHEEAVRRAEAAREADEDWGSMPEYAWAAVTTVYDDLTFKRTYRKYGNDDAPEAVE